MQWRGRRESGNVLEQPSYGRRGLAIGGGGSLLLLLLVMFLGGNPEAIFQRDTEGRRETIGRAADPQYQELRTFVSVVLADTEDVWHEQFRRMGKVYREPKLVLFGGQVESGCGFASSAVGPFYCPEDETIYLDLDFFKELSDRFGAPGDFAQAYVIAHEVGHHVQNLLGTNKRVQQERQWLSRSEYNRLSVRLELQADFLAGLWAYHAQKTKNILEAGDLEEALRAANAIGDDRLQRRSQGTVVPDSFTHGTSEQRIRWFRRGFTAGDMRQADTFSPDYGDL